MPNKFWAAMEQYCGPITEKDVEVGIDVQQCGEPALF